MRWLTDVRRSTYLRERAAAVFALAAAVLATLYIAFAFGPLLTVLLPLAGAAAPFVAQSASDLRLGYLVGAVLVGLFVVLGAMTVGSLYLPAWVALVVGFLIGGDAAAGRDRDHTS
jgi:hypothetical protein